MSDDLQSKLVLLRLPGVGPVKFRQILTVHGDPDSAIHALGISSDHIDNVKREIELAEKLNIKFISDDSEYYPKKLLEIKNHPPILSVRGNIDTLVKPTVAMVGTRHATGAGLAFISDLAESFVYNGFTVVSGMAMGTDTAAHKGALRVSGNFQTIAVVAGGVDYIWPLENESLYNYIIECGAVVSEMPVGTKPVANNFIQRNRWIAGISEKLILGEADEKSGSMTTASFAIEFSRPIFAIPGHPSDSRSYGPNRLIQQGIAKLCMGQTDFFGENEKKSSDTEKFEFIENDVLDKLGIIPMSESVLAELVKKNISEIKRELTMLELKKLARKVNGGYIKY